MENPSREEYTERGAALGVDETYKYVEALEGYCEQLENKYSKLLDDVHDYRHEVQSMKVTVRNLCTHFGVDNEEELMKIYMPDGKGK